MSNCADNTRLLETTLDCVLLNPLNRSQYYMVVGLIENLWVYMPLPLSTRAYMLCTVYRLSDLHDELQDDWHLKLQLSTDAVDIGGRISAEQVHLLQCLAEQLPVRSTVYALNPDWDGEGSYASDDEISEDWDPD